MPVTDAARVHDQLTHPVLDGDGHWVESLPVVVDYVRQVAGAIWRRSIAGRRSVRRAWYAASWEERRNRRSAGATGGSPPPIRSTSPAPCCPRCWSSAWASWASTTASCIRHAVWAPTTSLRTSCAKRCVAPTTPWSPTSSPSTARHLTPAALIPCYSPDEAIAELEHAIKMLGLKAASFKGSMPRPIAAYATEGRAPAGLHRRTRPGQSLRLRRALAEVHGPRRGGDGPPGRATVGPIARRSATASSTGWVTPPTRTRR